MAYDIRKTKHIFEVVLTNLSEIDPTPFTPHGKCEPSTVITSPPPFSEVFLQVQYLLLVFTEK